MHRLLTGISVSMCAAVLAFGQYGGGGGGTTGGGTTGGGTTGATGGGGATAGYNFHQNYHIGFDRPEAWGLKYFASTSLLSGLQPPEPSTERRVGSVTVSLELGWVPQLDPGQSMIGFNGKAPE